MANNTSRNPEEVGRNKVRNMLLQSRALQNNCMQTKKKTTKKSLKHFLFLFTCSIKTSFLAKVFFVTPWATADIVPGVANLNRTVFVLLRTVGPRRDNKIGAERTKLKGV